MNDNKNEVDEVIKENEANAEEAMDTQTQEKTKKADTKKAAKADKKLAEALAERDDFKDKYQRTFSDFNNYKKRMLASQAEAVKDGQCEAIEKLLPVLDNFERAVEHIDDEENALAQGFKMVYRQFVETVEKMGVKEIPAVGEVFDPTRHQAIQMVEPQEGQESGTVATVVQKGYMIDDRIIRNSMVIVNK